MPQVRLLIFFTCSTIVLLGAKQNSWFPGTGLPIEVKRTLDDRVVRCLPTIPRYILPGGTVGYPAHPRLIRLSVRPSFCHITFKFSAENRLGPTDSINKYVKIVNRRGIGSQIFFEINLCIDSRKNQGTHTLLRPYSRYLTY